VRHRQTRIAALVIAAALAVGISLGSATPAVACSCMGPQPMAAYAGDPEQVIFTGTVGIPDARGVPVRVTRWFQSPDTPAIVWLQANGFGGDGASCGTPLPPAGSEWIFVAYLTEERQLGVNLCTPHAAAAGADGQAMFADALATFGQGRVMDPEPDPPATTTTPDSVPFPLLLRVALAAIAFVSGVALLVRRGRREPADQA
jgi:hypothetical protein